MKAEMNLFSDEQIDIELLTNKFENEKMNLSSCGPNCDPEYCEPAETECSPYWDDRLEREEDELCYPEGGGCSPEEGDDCQPYNDCNPFF